jgi:hypothetical protein
MTDEAASESARESAGDASSLPRRRVGDTPAAAGNEVTAGDSYRIVTDLVVGPNLRWRDNLFQAIFILVTLVLAVGVGALFWGAPGALVGALAGLIGGLILSGAALGVFRAYRHFQGRHR